MACLDLMYNQNSNHKSGPPTSPRISFSNDFADSISSVHSRQNQIKSTSPVSSDFEFSVSNHSMMSADELFFKGRLLPFKNNCSGRQKTTLRDELLAGEDDDGVLFNKPPKGSSSSSHRWKGLLGLKKSHIGSKKCDKRLDPVHEDVHTTNTSSSPQEMMNNGGSSSNCRDVEFRFQ